MQERRKEQRWPTYLGGQVSFASQHSTADCLIRNASTGGAKLVVRQARFVPDGFELAITQRDIVYRAHVRWRSRDEFGVELEPMSSEKNAPVSLSLMRRLKRTETENAKLKRRIAELSQ
jgi:hypothetical protein